MPITAEGAVARCSLCQRNELHTNLHNLFVMNVQPCPTAEEVDRCGSQLVSVAVKLRNTLEVIDSGTA